MKAWLMRLFDALLGPPKSDVIATRPHVTLDPHVAAELERRLAEIDFRPTVGFYRDLPEDTQ